MSQKRKLLSFCRLNKSHNQQFSQCQRDAAVDDVAWKKGEIFSSTTADESYQYLSVKHSWMFQMLENGKCLSKIVSEEIWEIF
jgi:hypothetical protein